MYLSRIRLDAARKDTMRALANPYYFHGAIEKAEPGERTRKLWRVDRLGGELYLLIVSEEPLCFDHVLAQFGFEGDEVLSRDYAPLLSRITEGSRWQFRLKANPTIQKYAGFEKEGRGKVYAHATVKYQEQWLLDRAGRNGFSLEPGDFLVTESRWYSFQKRDRARVKILGCVYEGILAVTDADLFRKALTRGIGREKAYGMGMLTVMAAEQEGGRCQQKMG